MSSIMGCICTNFHIFSINQTCQQAILLQPSNTQALYRLGDAQLCYYDNSSSSTDSNLVLHEAELTFRASIEQEGKPCDSAVIPAQLSDQSWFKKRLAQKEAEATKATAAAPKTPQKGGATVGRGAKPISRGAVNSQVRGATGANEN